jgi:casein kinase II subunit alpha
VNDGLPASHFDYERYEIPFSDIEDYELVDRLAETRHAHIFLGLNICRGTAVVLKVMKPAQRRRVQREVKILRTLQGHANIVRLEAVVFDEGTQAMSLVMEKAEDDGLMGLTLTDLEVRVYMHGLLSALDHCHSHGIMHRDIHPASLMVNKKRRTLTLIDWGSA